MEIIPDKWVKPFSSGMSCINCIGSECIRDVTPEECANICKNSKRCNFGYHVKLPNEKESYCLPLNGFPHWGNPQVFSNSTLSPEGSPILNPNLGVQVTIFQNPDIKKSEVGTRSNISQLGIYLLRYRIDPNNPQDDLYLMDDMTFGKDPNTATQIVVLRDLPVSSGISPASEYVRNGELIYIKNSQTNNIFLCIDPVNFGFFPYTIRWSSSSYFYIEDLFHTQLITAYPFHHKTIKVGELFAIRCGTTPIDIYVLYWDIDRRTKKLVLKKVMKDEMKDFSHLERYKKFTLERQEKINIYQAENFVNSQSNYLLTTFPYISGNVYEHFTKWKILLIFILFSVILYFLMKHR